ncbi:Pyruvate/Phosphoenolpyruvate kinase-like domain-containing protein [Pseudomassariella vexata]|uniref:Pyruvate/Phosphoenolpyruvate kinase-like domain-containing protein n=1 Tax=Pseudomassariella vexata TaxID=1141098 RepID=A0A1Y2E8A6_9PEZI|nr:Pyruvate/Phosphoenolpyruvate kinase-like domain-containing protein [Pseudomassariella vexata]ORY67554.1 Pyruvate/Phosphoenolpyruvate kinase-like domain-containing protein [Pseudomassariella vexata]
MAVKGYLEQPHLHTNASFRSSLLTHPGNLREALRQAQQDPRKTLFGVAQGIPSTFVTKVIASTKPDFIWIDVEHGMFDRLTLHDAIHAAQHHSEGKTMVVVRVPKHDETCLSTALDAGASGIVIPHTESAQEVKDFIKEVYYPPIGARSFSPWTFTPGISDASLYPNDSFNMTTANRHSIKGVENADEIAAVEGISGLMFGPGDFKADAGLPLDRSSDTHPKFVGAIAKVAEAGKKYGKPLFGGAMSPEMIPMMIEQGYRCIAVIFDVWGLAHLVHGGVQTARGYAQKAEKADDAAIGHTK